jgi:hypothetical protein
MVSSKRILKFWIRLLAVMLPLYGTFVLLALVTLQATGQLTPGWQLPLQIGASLLPPTLALAGAVALATRFLRRFYDLRGRREAFWHIVHCLFGQASFKPWVLIDQAQIGSGQSGPDSMVARVGGPGDLVIRNDSAVVLEQNGKLTRVEGPGRPNLGRFERVHQVVDLRPQRNRSKFFVKGLSKEGIPVRCELELYFQIQSGLADPESDIDPGNPVAATAPSLDVPFPMDPDAVLRAATSATVRQGEFPGLDKVLDWRTLTVLASVPATMRSILARYPLDYLIRPEREGDAHPRQTIRAELEKAMSAAAAHTGARILKVELGQICVDDKVTQKWIEGWRAHWESWESEYLAWADAQYHRQVEGAKAEIMAERIRAMARLLHEVAQQDKAAFITTAKMQMYMILRSVESDSLALTFMPAEAIKLLEDALGLDSTP